MRLTARPTGARIIGTLGQVTVRHAIDHATPLTRDARINVTDEHVTEPGSYEPLSAYGEDLYLGEDGRVYLAGDVEAHDDEGERRSDVQPLPSPPARVAGGRAAYAARALRALEYAHWVIHSDHALEGGEIDQVTRDRVHARAREHADAAGVTLLVDAIVAATQL